jgi:hypothetical protein
MVRFLNLNAERTGWSENELTSVGEGRCVVTGSGKVQYVLDASCRYYTVNAKRVMPLGPTNVEVVQLFEIVNFNMCPMTLKVRTMTELSEPRTRLALPNDDFEFHWIMRLPLDVVGFQSEIYTYIRHCFIGFPRGSCRGSTFIDREAYFVF